MSRIHEALKRAEKERTSDTIPSPMNSMNSPMSSVADVNIADVPPPPSRIFDPLSESVLSQPERGAKIRADEFLRFDEVWNHCTAANWSLDPRLSIFADPNAAVSATEQFRTLRSRLYHLREKQPLRSLLVTSALAGEGKTFVANNLAQVLARQQERKVLLIDADLRCPALHLSLGASSSAPGLTDYLRGDVDEMGVIQRGLSDYLCFIGGGTRVENPAELLSNGRFNVLLEKIAPVFDWVILDSPPTLPVSDAMVLADLCDGVLVVVRAAYTNFDCAQKSCQQLHEKNLAGVVLNCAGADASTGAYYAYHYGNVPVEA